MADKKKSSGGHDANVVSAAKARRQLARKKLHVDDPLPHLPRNGIYPQKKGKPPNWTADGDTGLPVDPPFPVQCLGHKDGEYFYISSSGEFRALIKHDHEAMAKLFALCPNYPAWCCPRYGQAPKKRDDGDDDDDREDDGTPRPARPKPPPPINSFHDDQLRTLLLRACERRGMFDPELMMRGRGGWILRGGQVVYHAGEELWVYDGQPDAGSFKALPTGIPDGERHLYPRLPELPAPWPVAIAPESNQAGALYRGLSTFNWRRPVVDAVLLAGWVGIGYLGGAVDWRSSVCIVGDKGTGKSTIQDGFKTLFGDALLGSANASAAFVYQRLNHDSCPCELDELEPGAHEAKVRDLVELMRHSASGSIAGRGSAGGKAVAYQVRSAFLFSAINNPIDDPADLSRVAVLRLKPLEPGKVDPPVIDGDRCGPMILARMMSQWGNPTDDKPAGWNFYDTRKLYMDALAQGGHDARGQKTYGTLLAAAELMLGVELADELGVPVSRTLEGEINMVGLEWWRNALSVAALPEAENALPNWRRCADHLFTKAVEPWRGGARTSVGIAVSELVTSEKRQASGQAPPGDKGHYTSDQAKAELARTGLGLRHASEVLAHYRKERACSAVPCSEAEAERALGLTQDDGWLLAVPNDHPELRLLFRETPWTRTWMDALRQCPIDGVMVTDSAINRVTIGGSQKRCTLIVWKRFQEAPER